MFPTVSELECPLRVITKNDIALASLLTVCPKAVDGFHADDMSCLVLQLLIGQLRISCSETLNQLVPFLVVIVVRTLAFDARLGSNGGWWREVEHGHRSGLRLHIIGSRCWSQARP